MNASLTKSVTTIMWQICLPFSLVHSSIAKKKEKKKSGCVGDIQTLSIALTRCVALGAISYDTAGHRDLLDTIHTQYIAATMCWRSRVNW